MYKEGDGMATFEIGRVCMKTTGREAGRYCVVLQEAGKRDKTGSQNFVMVSGPRLLTGIKRRKCNIVHLKPTQFKIEITERASDEELIAAYDKIGLVKKLDLEKPSHAEMKGEKKIEKQ